MVDIKELVRTYVFLNNERVQQVTTKFGAVLVAVAAVTAGVWASTQVLDGEPAEPAAQRVGQGEASETCMAAGELAAWYEQHPEAQVLDEEVQPGGGVCITYEA